jgi:hypothetical protein
MSQPPNDEDRILRVTFSPGDDIVAPETLRALVRGEILAIVSDGFYSADACAAVSERLGRARWGSYDGIEIGRVGVSLFDCLGNPDCEEYFANVRRSRAQIHEALFPLANPADLVQKGLDLAWSHGCTTLTIAGRKCFFGLPRSFADGGDALPHCDRCDWDLPSPETAAVRAQLAFNLYLAMAEHGGELELWDLRPDRLQYDASRESYGVARSSLPPPDVVLQPRIGQLVIFDASRVHAVRPSTGEGKRITFSGFVGYRGDEQALVAFS